MAAAKKVVLFPAEMVSEMKRREKMIQAPETTVKLALDLEMENILKSNMSEVEKLHLYNNVLQQYLSVQSPISNNAESHVNTSNEDAHDTQQKIGEIISHFDNRNSVKAATILKALANDLNINDTAGTLFKHGDTATDGNIVDILNHLFKNNPPKRQPAGFEQFANLLASSKVPISIVPNSNLRNKLYNKRDITKGTTTNVDTSVTSDKTEHSLSESPFEPYGSPLTSSFLDGWKVFKQ